MAQITHHTTDLMQYNKIKMKFMLLQTTLSLLLMVNVGSSSRFHPNPAFLNTSLNRKSHRHLQAAEACTERELFKELIFSEDGITCDCFEIESANEFDLLCDEDCTYCNDEGTICGVYSDRETFDSAGDLVTANQIFTYTSGRNDVVNIEYFDCANDLDNCNSCSVSVNFMRCSSCEMMDCGDGTKRPSFNCAAIQDNSQINMCHRFATVGEEINLEATTNVFAFLSSFEYLDCANELPDICVIIPQQGGSILTFEDGESLGDAVPSPCGSTEDYPCYCNGVTGEPICPYCDFPTIDPLTTACAADGEVVTFIDPVGTNLACECEYFSDGSTSTSCVEVPPQKCLLPLNPQLCGPLMDQLVSDGNDDMCDCYNFCGSDYVGCCGLGEFCAIDCGTSGPLVTGCTLDDVTTMSPTETSQPSPSPSEAIFPSNTPTMSIAPSAIPSVQPSESAIPTFSPIPSAIPTMSPSPYPSDSPSNEPSVSISDIPSETPSFILSPGPSFIPSDAPSLLPSLEPSNVPSIFPSSTPSEIPSNGPSSSPSLSEEPSSYPSGGPTITPSSTPTSIPSDMPSLAPSFTPSMSPTQTSSSSPSEMAPTSNESTVVSSAQPTATSTTNAPSTTLNDRGFSATGQSSSMRQHSPSCSMFVLLLLFFMSTTLTIWTLL